MSINENPYESPAEVEETELQPAQRGGSFATFLLVLCLLDGSLKLVFLTTCLARAGIDLVFSLTQPYDSIGRGWFVLGSLYFVAETIAPWFGLWHLIRCKQGLLTVDQALWKTLAAAGTLSLVITGALVAMMEMFD